MIELPFQQVDVFSSDLFKGNPVAVILDADDLSNREMALGAVKTFMQNISPKK